MSFNVGKSSWRDQIIGNESKWFTHEIYQNQQGNNGNVVSLCMIYS